MTSNNQISPVNGSTAASKDLLIKEATKAKDQSYSPYSKFRVGAALLTDDNQLFTGCNVENASYGLSICAERTALVKAVSSGYTKFTELAVATDMDEHCSPCGACRQFIAEFGLDIVVHLVNRSLEYETTTSGDLLPRAFTPEDLVRHAKLKDQKNKSE